MGSPYGIKCYALLSNATVVSRIVDTLCSGKKTAKQVPLRPGCVLLRIRIQPPCLSTIPLATHRPRPVPFSPFVVKNGSKILRRFSPEIPGPLSAMKTRTPCIVGFLQSREAITCNSSVPPGVKASSIPHKIGEYLGYLAGKAVCHVLRVVSLLDDNHKFIPPSSKCLIPSP